MVWCTETSTNNGRLGKIRWIRIEEVKIVRHPWVPNRNNMNVRIWYEHWSACQRSKLKPIWSLLRRRQIKEWISFPLRLKEERKEQKRSCRIQRQEDSGRKGREIILDEVMDTRGCDFLRCHVEASTQRKKKEILLRRGFWVLVLQCRIPALSLTRQKAVVAEFRLEEEGQSWDLMEWCFPPKKLWNDIWHVLHVQEKDSTSEFAVAKIRSSAKPSLILLSVFRRSRIMTWTLPILSYEDAGTFFPLIYIRLFPCYSLLFTKLWSQCRWQMLIFGKDRSVNWAHTSRFKCLTPTPDGLRPVLLVHEQLRIANTCEFLLIYHWLSLNIACWYESSDSRFWGRKELKCFTEKIKKTQLRVFSY